MLTTGQEACGKRSKSPCGAGACGSENACEKLLKKLFKNINAFVKHVVKTFFIQYRYDDSAIINPRLQYNTFLATFSFNY